MKKNIPFLLLTIALIFSLFMCEREKELLGVDESDLKINTNAFLLTFKDNSLVVKTEEFSIPILNVSGRVAEESEKR